MQQRENNPIFRLVEAIAYFLAGSFAIKTVTPLHSSEGVLQPSNVLVSVIGGVLIIFGFMNLLVILLHDHLQVFIRWINRVSPYLYSILFAITTTEIVKVLVDFSKIPFLSWITTIFLVFVLVTIFYTSFRVVFQNIRFLLNACLSFNIMAVILIFIGNSKYQAISFICFSSILIFLVLYRITRRAQRQHDIP